jgi:hypothetical protein
MTYIVGRGVRVEIGMTEGSAKTVSAITKAAPPVATSTSHGLTAKTLGYMSGVGGMVQLEGQAVRFSAVDTNTLTLEDLDTTSYATFTAGSLIPVATWATLGSTTSYSKGEGAADALDATTLLDDIKQEISGLMAAETVSFNLNAQTISDTALAKVRSVAKASGYLVFRVTFKDGNVRFFRGQPGLPGEEVQKGSIGTGTISVKVQGYVCEGAV